MFKSSQILLRIAFFAIAACAAFQAERFRTHEAAGMDLATMAARGLPLLAIPAPKKRTGAVWVNRPETGGLVRMKQVDQTRIHMVISATV